MSKVLLDLNFSPNLKIFLLIGIFILCSNFGYGQVRVATVSGNWNSTTTWGGQPVPVSANDVEINPGVIVTVTANAACNSLLLKNSPNNGVETRLEINSGVSLIVGSGSGLVTIGSGTSMGNRNVSKTEVLVNGNLFSGTIDQRPGVRLIGSGGSGNTFLTINGDGIVTSTGSLTGTNNGTSGNFLGTANVVINSTGNLKLTGTFDTSEFTNLGSSTVEYNGGNQIIRNAQYANLTLSGSGTKTLPSLPSISGNLSLSGTASATTTGDLAIGGNLSIGNGATLTTGNNFSLSVAGTSQIGGGSSGQLILGGTGTKTFTGNVTLDNGATWNESGLAPINFSLDLINNGNFTANSGIHTFSGDNRLIGGSSAISIGNLNITGTYTNNTSLTTSNLTGSGTLTQGINSTLNLSGTYPITSLIANANCPNTVNYSGANQTVLGINYCNLSLNGSGVKTLLTGTNTILGNFSISGTTSTISVIGLTIGGNISIGAGTSFSAGTFTHNVAGNWSNAGTFNAGTSTINFNGASSGNIGSSNFNNITFSGAGTKTATGALTIAGNVTVSNNFTAGAFTHTVSGNWTRTGTFTATGSTIEFTGATDASIETSNFQNITFSGAGTKTAIGALTIAGNVNISNNFTAGSFTHTVGGDWSRAGAFVGTGSTINFNGAGAASIGTSNFQNVIFSGAGTKTATGALTIAGNVTVSNNFTAGTFTHTVGGDWNRAGTFVATGSTIDFNGATAASIGVSNFQNITFSGAGTKTATGALIISGNVVISNNFTAGAFTHNVDGNWTNSGTFTPDASTINFNGTGPASIGASNFSNVTFSGAGIKTASGNLIITGNLNISNNFSASSFVHTISGDFTNSGTFVPGTSSMVFDKAGDQTISSPIFYKIQLQGSGNKFFSVSTTITELLDIEGNAVARLGSLNHTSLKFFISGNGQQAGTYGSPASYAIFQLSTYFGNTDTGILTVQINSFSCNTGTWLGTTNSDWNTATNWCNGIIPTSSIDVTVPAAAINQPIIGAGGGIARNLLIQSGASLTISGSNLLEVFGNWSLLGSFDPGATSTVEFKGSSNNSINDGSFANLSISGTGTKTLNGSLTVGGNITVNSLATVILTSPNTLMLNSGKTFEIFPTATFNTNGLTSKIILSPSSSYLNRSTSNPRLEVRQEFTGAKGWRMIGTPISTTYSTLISGLETQGFPGSTNPSLQPNLLWWDETDKGTSLQGWRQPSNLSDSVPAGRGHYFYIFNGAAKPSPATGNYTDALPKTISVTGTEINLASGSFDFGVTFTLRDTNLVAQADTLIEVNQTDEGFNLVANPTASTLDWDASTGWTKTNIDQSIYVWDPATEAFLTWNGTTGSLGSGRIAPYQGFWVKANAGSPVLQLGGNGAKSLVSSSFFGRKLEEKPLAIQLHIAGEGLKAESFISFDKEGKLGEDPKDAYQLESLAEDWLLLYTYGSLKTRSPLVINNQPELNGEEKIIPLHLAASKGGKAIKGTYLMDWQIPAEWPSDVKVVLMDHINQKAIDMQKESMYTFSFQGPEVPSTSARKSTGSFQAPKAVIFKSPYESGEVNSRVSDPIKPKRPFTIYIGSFPNDRIEYLPDFPKLFAPAPNPFSQQTKIRFYLPAAEQAEVQILDLMGKVVGNFTTQNYEAGIHELEWIPSAIDLPAGMYIVRLNTQDFQMSQKLIKN